jgi:hypothetical protein
MRLLLSAEILGITGFNAQHYLAEVDKDPVAVLFGLDFQDDPSPYQCGCFLVSARR